MLKEFHYKIDWRSKSHLPGHHRSNQSGGGIEFRGNVPLLASPDPRRLDIRASLSDPFDQWFVRSFRQRSQVPVYVIADLSASLGFSGERRKLDVLADFVESLAYSAHRSGDRFAFIGCDETLRTDFFLPPTHAVGAGLDLARRVRGLSPVGTAAGLLEASHYMVRQRCLVFLVSDFHFSDEMLEKLFASLLPHRICPIVLWDRAEYERLPRFGLITARDSETGRKRTLLLRPALRERLLASFSARRAKLNAFFQRHNTRPIFFERGFDAEKITQYFFEPKSDLLEEAA